jgi:large subunit ribosomal protein L2
LTEGLFVGDEICNYSCDLSSNITYSKGNKFFIKDIPLGSFINNIEFVEDKGAQISRSAGTFCVLLNKIMIQDKEYAIIRFASGVEYAISSNCTAILGIVSNIEHNLRIYRKAGTLRNMGVRPTVRGVAMNPIDHPHGGGEGRKSGRRAARSPWGKITRGVFTRTNIKTNKFIIKRNGKI